MKKFLFTFILFCIAGQIFGQQFWSKKEVTTSKAQAKEEYSRKSIPNKYEVYKLDLKEFTSTLLSKSNSVEILLPSSNGVFKKFRIKESSNLAPELSAKFPMIKSYTGFAIDEPTSVAKIDIGTNGFHAIIFSGNKSTLYIDPKTKDHSEYIVYQRSDLTKEDTDFMCGVDATISNGNKGFTSVQNNADDGMLRTFRLALASTGEYSQFHLNQQGVSSGATDAVKKAAVLSAMNTTMNRVNGVYERDLGVRMVIVANNDEIIFLDATTDGFTNNSSTALLSQNQNKCDTEIGSANYDIGHVFSTQGGGIAGLGVVCLNGQKGRGVTGTGFPMNDPYDIDYVAHEMGHQFGANHTFNNTCQGQRNSSTAVEPGSASTIMGYAGICSPNVQNNSDDHFHIVNIDEMWNRIQSTATCAVATSTGNAIPTANAGLDVSIPKSTPFVLRGIGTDADGVSSLTYNWEQVDNEIAAMPPQSSNTGGPMFRSLSSKTSPDRYMPDLSTVIAENTPTTWEVLPSVARNMDFALTVRDNNPGGGASVRDDIRVTVVDEDPFTVAGPISNVEWEGLTTQTINWNKGTTDIAPVNCSFVNIKLSIDGGLTFPITILANTPNDGSQDVTIPNNPTLEARIMVEAADNLFYNVNGINFTITEATASLDESLLSNFKLYPNPTNGLVNIAFDINNGNDVDIQFFDLTGRAVKKYSFNNNTGRFSETVNTNQLASGIYLVKIKNGSKTTIKKLIVE